jgi:hypothetical protein
MDYQGNSNKKKAAETSIEPVKKIEKVELSGKVISRKKPLGARIKMVFFGGEFSSAMQYLGAEVLLPAFRNLLVEATTKGIEKMVYGDSPHSRTRTPEYRPRVTYNNPINRPSAPRANLPDQPNRSRQSDTEIIFNSRSDAELVLERLQDIIDLYQVVSMADLNSIVGLPGSYIDNKWGWEHLQFAEIRQTRDGFLLNLPPAQAI